VIKQEYTTIDFLKRILAIEVAMLLRDGSPKETGHPEPILLI
jgi:hypothetical protein